MRELYNKYKYSAGKFAVFLLLSTSFFDAKACRPGCCVMNEKENT